MTLDQAKPSKMQQQKDKQQKKQGNCTSSNFKTLGFKGYCQVSEMITEREKFFVNHVSAKVRVSRIHKEDSNSVMKQLKEILHKIYTNGQ